MVDRSSTYMAQHYSADKGYVMDPPDDSETASIDVSKRANMEAPGRVSKEVLASDARGRKIYVEHHQKGHKPHRHHGRVSSVEDRNPRSATESSPGNRIGHARGDDRATPKDVPRRGTLDRIRERSKAAKQKKKDRHRSLSPRKFSRKEPLIIKPAKDRSRSRNSRIKRLQTMKVKILDDEEEPGIPLYTPPVIPDQESIDDGSSSNGDKYSVTAAPDDSDMWKRKENRNPSMSSESQEALKWSKDETERREGHPTRKDASSRQERAQASEASLPSSARPSDKRNLPLDSLKYSASENGSFSAWISTTSETNVDSGTSAKESLVTEGALRSVVDIATNNENDLSSQKQSNSDSGLDSPRKSTSYSDVSRMSSRDLESGRFLNSSSEEVWSASDDGIIILKQRVAYCCIGVSAIQMGLLIIQLSLCGVASLRINPMIGPYPDAFSEWGGKNVYLLLEKQQYFRLITPILLHVGIIHLLINAYCQLELCASFEREWGSGQWITIYLISGIGSVLTSSAIDPDLISVCSSGALMGMFGAKIAQVITWTAFELKSSVLEDAARIDQLGGVSCSAAMLSLLSFFTYIDWSGHLGGLFAGFLVGMTLFAKPIASRSKQAIWGSFGLLGLIIGAIIMFKVLFHTVPDEDLGDACQFFNDLYPDGYVCECVWD